VPRDVPPQQES
jgi:hypothetical protein